MSSVYIQNRVPSDDTRGDVTVTSVINRLSPISLRAGGLRARWHVWGLFARVGRFDAGGVFARAGCFDACGARWRVQGAVARAGCICARYFDACGVCLRVRGVCGALARVG